MCFVGIKFGVCCGVKLVSSTAAVVESYCTVWAVKRCLRFDNSWDCKKSDRLVVGEEVDILNQK